MFWLFISFGFINFIVNGQQFVMPPCDESYNCISSLTQSECLRNEFLEIDWTSSCCPVCRGGLGKDKSVVLIVPIYDGFYQKVSVLLVVIQLMHAEDAHQA